MSLNHIWTTFVCISHLFLWNQGQSLDIPLIAYQFILKTCKFLDHTQDVVKVILECRLFKQDICLFLH